MGENPLKSISFMKNQCLLFSVFYENQYLSAEKEKSHFSSQKFMTSEIYYTDS